MSKVRSAETTTTRAEGDVVVTFDPPPLDSVLAAIDAEKSAPDYVAIYKQAQLARARGDLHAVEAMDVLRECGLDTAGRAVFMFIPGNLNLDAARDGKAAVTLELVTQFCVLKMHDWIVQDDKHYAIIWLCNNIHSSQLSYRFFRRTYKMVPYAFRKNMRSLSVVHPGIKVRMLLFLLSYITKTSFWEKLHYADRVEFLDEVHALGSAALMPTCPQAGCAPRTVAEL